MKHHLAPEPILMARFELAWTPAAGRAGRVRAFPRSHSESWRSGVSKANGRRLGEVCDCCGCITTLRYLVLIDGQRNWLCLFCEDQIAATDKSRRPVSEGVYEALIGKVPANA